MKKDQVQALIRAHASGDNDTFRRAALQIACAFTKANERDEIRRLVERDPELPREVGSIWHAVEPAERPWFPAEVAEQIDELIDMFRYRVELAGLGVKPVTRVLLCGPPGCGKTMTARWFAAELSMSAYVLRLSATMSSFLGSTSANLAKAIESTARIPSVWVFDEIDALTARRTDGSDGVASREYSSIVNSLCVELDKIGITSGLIVGTTNRVDIMDPAILRRFDVVVEWPEPSEEDLLAFAWHVGGVPAKTYAETFTRTQMTKRREALRKVKEGGK